MLNCCALVGIYTILGIWFFHCSSAFSVFTVSAVADNRFPSIRIELNIWTGLPSVLWDPSFFDVFSAIGATLLVVTFDLVHHFGESSNIKKEERQRNSQRTSFLVLSQERHCPFEQSQITPYQKDFVHPLTIHGITILCRPFNKKWRNR